MLTCADVCDMLARQKQPLTWLEGIAHELAKVRPHALVLFFLSPHTLVASGLIASGLIPTLVYLLVAQGLTHELARTREGRRLKLLVYAALSF